MYNTTIQAFQEDYLDTYLQKKLLGIKDEVSAMTTSQLEGAQKELNERIVAPLDLQFDQAQVTDYEKDVPADQHPNAFFTHYRDSYSRQVIVYHIPFIGDLELLKYAPNPNLLWTCELEVRNTTIGKEVCFEVIAFGNDPAHVKQEFEEAKNKLSAQLGNITKQVLAYNERLPHQVQEFIANRKQELGKQKGMLDQLGVPVRKSVYDQ